MSTPNCVSSKKDARIPLQAGECRCGALLLGLKTCADIDAESQCRMTLTSSSPIPLRGWTGVCASGSFKDSNRAVGKLHTHARSDRYLYSIINIAGMVSNVMREFKKYERFRFP